VTPTGRPTLEVLTPGAYSPSGAEDGHLRPAAFETSNLPGCMQADAFADVEPP
jgi:hypothetical protein